MGKYSPLHILGALLGALSLASCSLTSDDSGDLGQYWHLTSIDTLATEGSCDVAARRVFWAFQGAILQTYDFSSGQTYVFHYNHSNNTLTLTEPRINDRTKGDPLVEDLTVLYPMGIHAAENAFAVEELGSGKMIIADEQYRLHFRAQ